MAGTVRRFIRDEAGATAIEYGLIAGLVAVAIIASMIAVGNGVSNMFNYISNHVVPVLGR